MRLLIRTDTSPQIGAGHLMRCLALAQRWQERGHEVLFLLAEGGQDVAPRLQSEKLAFAVLPAVVGSTEDQHLTRQQAIQWQADWLLIDGYRFDQNYLQAVSAPQRYRLIQIDDDGFPQTPTADLILNQNLHACAELYPASDPGRLLLGLYYQLLRREFRQIQGHSDQHSATLPAAEARKVLISLGASDPDNISAKVLDWLQPLDIGPLQLRLIIGATNPHRQQLEERLQQYRHPAQLLRNVDNMPEHYQWADLAITAGGSTLWELAYMGLPSLNLVVADNQVPSSTLLHAQGAILSLGRPQTVTPAIFAQAFESLYHGPQARQAMSQAGHKLVDGNGVDRVIDRMVILNNGSRSKTAIGGGGEL